MEEVIAMRKRILPMRIEKLFHQGTANIQKDRRVPLWESSKDADMSDLVQQEDSLSSLLGDKKAPKSMDIKQGRRGRFSRPGVQDAMQP